jgi:hypothetical protein
LFEALRVEVKLPLLGEGAKKCLVLLVSYTMD